jgi:hypothetical protein
MRRGSVKRPLPEYDAPPTLTEVSVHVKRPRRSKRILAAAAAALAIGAAGAQADTAPTLNAPGPGKLLATGSLPTFKATDHGHAFQGTLWLSISANRARDRFGRLKESDGGTFSKMVRHRGGHYTFTPPVFTFPGWFMATPGTYFWQVYHINCLISNASRTSCHVYSRVRSFKVG